MTRTFSCPNCAAPLNFDGGTDYTIACPFCKSSVIVPAELRTGMPSAFSLTNLPDIAGQSHNLAKMARLVRAGNKIEAIKLYRQVFHVGLKDAKDAIEALARGEPIQFSNMRVGVPSTMTFTPIDQPMKKAAMGIAGASCSTIALSVGLPLITVAIVLFSVFGSDLGMLIGLIDPTPISSRILQSTASPAPTRLPTVTPTPQFASVASQFGSVGINPGFFNDARSLALDGAGNIYVADYQSGRVQAFDATGKYLTQWNAGNSKTLVFSLAASRQGTVYVVADGEIKRYEGATGKSLGSFQYPDGNKFDSIAVTGDGNVYAMWYEARNGLITGIQGHREDLVRFDADGKVKQVFRGIISEQSGNPEFDAQIAVDGLGNLFILANNADYFVFAFTPEGKFVNRFSARGDKPGQMNSPNAIALDGRGRLFIADFKGVHVFESSGQFIDVFKVDVSIGQMAFNDKNELLAVVRDRVVKFALTQR